MIPPSSPSRSGGASVQFDFDLEGRYFGLLVAHEEQELVIAEFDERGDEKHVVRRLVEELLRLPLLAEHVEGDNGLRGALDDLGRVVLVQDSEPDRVDWVDAAEGLSLRVVEQDVVPVAELRGSGPELEAHRVEVVPARAQQNPLQVELEVDLLLRLAVEDVALPEKQQRSHAQVVAEQKPPASAVPRSGLNAVAERVSRDRGNYIRTIERGGENC